jgi:hypothetical protein
LFKIYIFNNSDIRTAALHSFANIREVLSLSFFKSEIMRNKIQRMQILQILSSKERIRPTNKYSAKVCPPSPGTAELPALDLAGQKAKFTQVGPGQRN